MSNISQDKEFVNKLLEQRESEWLEFKSNWLDYAKMGKSCSALSNGAAMIGRDKGYIVWGIDDETRRIEGTTFDPESSGPGNQDLRLWLGTMLTPRPSLYFKTIHHPEGRLVLLEVSAATEIPTAFQRIQFIRVGSHNQYLQDHPQLFRKLISILETSAWEEAVAAEQLGEEQVLELLDWKEFFNIMKLPDSKSPISICEKLKDERIIVRNDAGRWCITNLGAILLARNLSNFGALLESKSVRVVVYRGADKTSCVRDDFRGERGFALDLVYVMNRLYSHVPVSQRMGGVLRSDIPDYPELATREILVNALIHQDFRVTDAGPLLFMFSDRLEVGNPGKSLVPSERMIGSSPHSRNRELADLARRMGLCEVMGSGLVKVIKEVEAVQLPPPNFRVDEDATQVTLFAPKEFSEMTMDERLRACRHHAVIKRLQNTRMTNATLRERLGLPSNNRGAAHASLIIRAALEKGLITHFDPTRPRAGYVPGED